jgi:hypothetical protein
MKEFSRVVSAEVLKLRRTLALRLAALTPLTIVILVFGIYAQRHGAPPPGTNPLTGFAQLILTMWTIILLPLYAGLVAALLASIEHQGDNWRHLLALPVRRSFIYAAKWVAGIALLLVSSLVLPASVSAAAEVLRVMKPGWSSVALPTIMIFRGALLSFCAAGLLFSIQMWISLRWRSFLPGLVVAAVALILMFMSARGGTSLFASIFPWSLPAMAMAPNSPHRVLAISWGLFGGAAVGAIACFFLSRHEFE